MATETFDLCSEFPGVRVSMQPALSTPDGSPIVRARTIDPRPLRTWSLSWSGVPRELLLRLRILWREAGYGPSQAMDFTPPGESAIEARFRSGTLTYQIESPTTCSFSLELEEVR